LADKTTKLKGNGHINVSNVNSVNSECILLTYTIWNFKDSKQITSMKNAIYDMIDGDISFDLQVMDWTGEEERQKLKCKIKSCNKEKEAHKIKTQLDEFIRKKGGQTTLDEAVGDGEK